MKAVRSVKFVAWCLGVSAIFTAWVAYRMFTASDLFSLVCGPMDVACCILQGVFIKRRVQAERHRDAALARLDELERQLRALGAEVWELQPDAAYWHPDKDADGSAFSPWR